MSEDYNGIDGARAPIPITDASSAACLHECSELEPLLRSLMIVLLHP